MTTLEDLLAGFAAAEPRLDIWRRYPDISEAEDALTDSFACEAVSALFAAYAGSQGWRAVTVRAEGAEAPLADYHVWVRLTCEGRSVDVDWTARQYHNLHRPEGRDEAVLALPWPLVWPATGQHPVVGKFATFGSLGLASALRR